VISPTHGIDPVGVQRLGNLRGRGSPIEPLAWSPDGSRLAAGCSDHTVLVWTVDAGSPFEVLPQGCTVPIRHLAWSPDGSRLAVAGGECIRVWCAGPSRFEKERDVDPGGNVVCLAWSPGGALLRGAVVLGQGAAEELSLQTWEPLRGRLVESRGAAVWKLAWSAISSDRRWLALSLTTGQIEIWSLETGELRAALTSSYQPLFGVAISPDDQTAVLAYQDGSFGIWDLAHGRWCGDIQAHRRPAHSIAFSHNGRVLATKSRDGTVRFHHCDTWHDLGEIEEPASGTAEPDLAFRPSSSELVTLGERNTVIRRWKLDIPTLIMTGEEGMISILYLSAEPTRLQHLKIGEEVRKIELELRLSKLREKFYFETHLAVRPEDLTRALLELRPQIISFSGHGSSTGEILLEGASGELHPVNPEALATLFKIIRSSLQCVILNACYSEIQAEAIRRVVPYVIGMSGGVNDDAAIAFSLGFYQALGSGSPIPEAFEAACAQVTLAGIHSPTRPVLLAGSPEDASVSAQYLKSLSAGETGLGSRKRLS
jgi:WD40 repeat protein